MKKESKKNQLYDEETSQQHKYQNLGMSLGMCFGMCLGLSVSDLLFGNMTTGMCLGLPIGMCLGMTIGAAMDKQYAEKIFVIERIDEDDFGCEGVPEGTPITVTVHLKNGNGDAKTVRMEDNLMYQRNLNVGSKVTLAEDGTLHAAPKSDANMD